MSYRIFSSDLDKIDTVLAALEISAASDPVSSSGFEMKIVELYGRWEQFLRDYLLELAARKRFACACANRDLREYTLKEYLRARNRKMEPKWAIPDDALAFCRAELSAIDLGKITPILAATPWKLEELRWARNYLAHRSQETARKLMKHAALANGARRLHHYALTPEAGAAKYSLWVRQMRGIVAMLPP